MFAIKNREDLETSEELASLKNQVHELRLQDKIGTQIFSLEKINLFEPLNDKLENTSENLTKIITETCIETTKH